MILEGQVVIPDEGVGQVLDTDTVETRLLIATLVMVTVICRLTVAVAVTGTLDT